MLPRVMRSGFAVLSMAFLGCLIPSTAQAGWWWGGGPYGYGSYYRGYPVYAAPYYASYGPIYPAVAYPTTSYYYGSFTADYGCSSCCNSCGGPCDTGCSSCGSCWSPCAGGCSPCGTGGCASGNCGASFTPPTTDDTATPKPTEVNPSGGVPPTYRNEPPPDNFVPADRRERDTPTGPMTPVNPMNPMNPPNRPSTIPPRGNSTVPPNSTNPSGEVNPFDDSFMPPNTPRSPASAEPSLERPGSDSDILPGPLGTEAPKPINLEPAPVASAPSLRDRVETHSRMQIPSVVRIRVAPRLLSDAIEPHLARK